METYSLLSVIVVAVIAFYLGKERGFSEGLESGKKSSWRWVIYFKDRMLAAERLNREKLFKIHELQDTIEQLEEENQRYKEEHELK